MNAPSSPSRSPSPTAVPTSIAPRPSQDEGGLDLRQTWATLKRRLLLVMGVAAAVTAAAVTKALSDAPIYTGRFEILVQQPTVEREVTAALPEALTGSESLLTGVSEDLLRILTSSKVLLPVIQQIQTDVPELCDRLTVPTIEAAGDRALTSAQVTNLCYQAVLDQLTVQTLGDASNIVEVTYQGTEPDEVTLLLERLSAAYLAYSLESRQSDIQLGIEFVEGKLPDLQNRVATLQDQLLQLRQQYDLIDPESRGEQLASQVNTFTQEQLAAQIDLEQARVVASELEGQLARVPAAVAASSELSNNLRYQSLVTQFLELEAQIAEASTLYLSAAPEMQVLQEQRQNLLTLLERESRLVQREVDGRLQQLEVRDRALQDTLSDLSSQVNELSVISRVYSDIQRELQIATDTLSQFLAKREALQIDAAQRDIPWELLTPPTDPEPVAASLMRNLILGGMLGVLTGIGLALLLERVTDIVYTLEELRRMIQLPVIGLIPPNPTIANRSPLPSPAAPISVPATPVPAADRPHRTGYYNVDPFNEAFRSLYANLRLLNTDDPVRSIVISSCVPNEGKSTTAIHLARAAAAMTQRVLLIDTDLRRPRLHDYLGLTNSGGLTDVLAGDVQLRQAVQRLASEPNLYVLTAGTLPPDPTRLLSSQKMQRLMAYLQTHFDLVIYDAPPLIGFADPVLLATHTHGLVLVAELGRLKRSLLQQAIEQVTVSSTPMLGIVLQKQKPLKAY